MSPSCLLSFGAALLLSFGGRVVVVCSAFLRFCLQSFQMSGTLTEIFGWGFSEVTEIFSLTEIFSRTGIFTKKGASVIFISFPYRNFQIVEANFLQKKPQSR